MILPLIAVIVASLKLFQSSDDISTHEKLDFWLNLPSSSFMVAKTIEGDFVTDLLSSGELLHRTFLQLNNIDQDISQVTKVDMKILFIFVALMFL